MIKDGKFGVSEAVWLLTITITAKVFFSSPSMVATITGTAGWYMTLVSAGATFIVLLLLCSLLKRFPGKNLMDIYEVVLGKSIGMFFSLLLFAVLFITAIANLREFIDVLKVYALPLSPPSYLLILFISIISVLAFLGLETLARFSKLVAYILLAGYVIVLILAIPLYESHRLFPILGHGLWNTISHGLQRSSAYGEVIIIGIMVNSIHGAKHAKRAAYIGLALSGLIISSALLAFSLAFPYYTGQEITAPIYLMASLIEYGRFFQRIEPVFFFIWNISTVIAVAVIFYLSLVVYSHVFRLEDKRPLIIPYAIILFSLCMIPASITQVTGISVQLLREYGWAFFYIPPAVALLAAIIRKKERGMVQ
jgi:spore germination protein (amino acid permease)